jgi:hypothetical protein
MPFAYLGAPNADLYVAVLGAFAQARERFTVHLRPEDIAGELRSQQPDFGAVEVETVGAALEQLVRWGNLRADADTGRVTSVESASRPTPSDSPEPVPGASAVPTTWQPSPGGSAPP